MSSHAQVGDDYRNAVQRVYAWVQPCMRYGYSISLTGYMNGCSVASSNWHAHENCCSGYWWIICFCGHLFVQVLKDMGYQGDHTMHMIRNPFGASMVLIDNLETSSCGSIPAPLVSIPQANGLVSVGMFIYVFFGWLRLTPSHMIPYPCDLKSIPMWFAIIKIFDLKIMYTGAWYDMGLSIMATVEW